MVNEEDIEYEIVEVHRLPSVDVSKSVKKALLTSSGAKVYKAVCKKINFPCTLLYTIAFPIGASVLTVRADYARVLAIFKFLFQVPMLIMVSAGLRIDLLWCLTTTYEFWFFTVLNAATCVVFSLHFGDLRMIMAPVYWYGIQMNIWADGKVQGPRLASAAALAAVYHIFLLVVFHLHLTPAPHPFELLQHGGHSMTSDDFLVNSFTTMMVLMARTAYRKKALHKRSDDDPKVMQFVSYRCRVQLRQKIHVAKRNGPILLENGKAPVVDAHQPTPVSGNDQASPQPSVQRLRLVKLQMTFNFKNVIAPSVLVWMSRNAAWRLLILNSTGFLGFGLHVIACVCIRMSADDAVPIESFIPLSLLALSCTISFCGVYAMLYQRQILVRLVSSFDFIFISAQITMGYVCLCRMLNWDCRCIVLLTGWTWKHWILMLDGLTPKMKFLLGYRTHFALPLILFAVLGHLFPSLDLLLSNASEELQNQVLWSATMFGHYLEVKAVPFYLSRTCTALLWWLRILWRLLRSGSDDLIMLQGSVEFYGNPKALHKKEIRQKNRISAPSLGGPVRIQPDNSGPQTELIPFAQ